MGTSRAILPFALCLWVLFAGALRAEVLDAETRDRINADRSDFLDAAAQAINWFGDPRGLDQRGIDDYIAAERARRRADVLQLVLSADLSADGATSSDEVARLGPTLPPQTRGRLISRHAQADGNGDGVVDPAELQRFALAEALRLVPEERREDLSLILIFDADGDGWVTFEEVRQGLADIAA